MVVEKKKSTSTVNHLETKRYLIEPHASPCKQSTFPKL